MKAKTRDVCARGPICVSKPNPQKTIISPQYWKNVLNIEPMITKGLKPEEELNITTASKPIGKKKTP